MNWNPSGCSGGNCNHLKSELIESKALQVSASDAREASGSSDATSRTISVGKARRGESSLLPKSGGRSARPLDQNFLLLAGGTGWLVIGVD